MSNVESRVSTSENPWSNAGDVGTLDKIRPPVLALCPRPHVLVGSAQKVHRIQGPTDFLRFPPGNKTGNNSKSRENRKWPREGLLNPPFCVRKAVLALYFFLSAQVALRSFLNPIFPWGEAQKKRWVEDWVKI